MSAAGDLDTGHLIERVSKGDAGACQELLARHRDRLQRMVSIRLDPRLAARVDPSDVVQETLAEAFRKLPDYVRRRPLPFYPWLRQIAWDKLVELHRRHILAKRRSVRQEERWIDGLSENSAAELTGRLVDKATSASGKLLRKELQERVRTAFEDLSEHDREVLVLRHLEQLSTKDIAGVLGISEGAVKVRHLRALTRLRKLLGGGLGEDER